MRLHKLAKAANVPDDVAKRWLRGEPVTQHAADKLNQHAPALGIQHGKAPTTQAAVLRVLLAGPAQRSQIVEQSGKPNDSVGRTLTDLRHQGIVGRDGPYWSIANPSAAEHIMRRAGDSSHEPSTQCAP
jgi:hypothetical protein